MSFDLTTNECSIFDHQVKASLYKALYEGVCESKVNKALIKWSGLAIELTAALLTLATRIGSFAECIIKGVSNMFGALFSEDCDFFRGAKQFFIEAPSQLFSILGIVPQVFYNTICLASDPKAYLEELWAENDPDKYASLTLTWLEEKANNGSLPALNKLGKHYYKNGQSEIALEYFKKSKEKGDSLGEACLAELEATPSAPEMTKKARKFLSID